MEPGLAVVISKEVEGIWAAKAMEAILRFTTFIEATITSYPPDRSVSGRPAFGGRIAGTGTAMATSVGPCTRSDLTAQDAEAGLVIEGRVNGKIRITGNTQHVKFGVAHTISHAARCRTLYPGHLTLI